MPDEDGEHGGRQHCAVGEVDDVEHAVDERQAERDQRVDRTGHHAVQHRRHDDLWAKHHRSLRRIRSRSGRHRKDDLGVGEFRRKDHLDVAPLHLRVHGGGARILSVDELRRPVGHEMVGERRGCERLGHLGPIGGGGPLQGIGQQEHGRIVHRHVVGPELALRFEALAQRFGCGLARIVPVVAVHDELRRLREFLHEAEVGRGAVEHGVDGLGLDLLLLHGARQKHELAVIARGDQDVRVLRLDLQRDVRHVARGRGMRQRVQHLEAALG